MEELRLMRRTESIGENDQTKQPEGPLEQLKKWDQKLEMVQTNKDIKNRDQKQLKILGKKAEVLLTLEKYQEALDIYNYLYSQEIDCKTYIHRGICLSKLHRDEEAIFNYNEGIQQYPDAFELHYNKGYVLKKLKRYEEAIHSYDLSLAYNSQDISSLHNKGNIFKIIHQPEQAVNQYDQILKIDPQNCNALINKGLTLKQMKRDEEATQCFKQAQAIDNSQKKVIYKETNTCTLCDSTCSLI